MPDRAAGSTNNTPHLTLVSLGAPRVVSLSPTGVAIVSLGTGKPAALIAYLAFAPRRTATRERLCDLLWGETDPDSARAALRQTLWLIKQQVGPDLITSSPAGLSLTCTLDVDADHFAAAVESDELDHALDLYTGDFFRDFASPGAREFENWAELQRARLRALFVHAAESLARRHLDQGRFADAQRVARLLRERDPFGETGWRLLLEALSSAGDSIGARAEADHFEHWLLVEERDGEPASLAALRSAHRVPRPAPPSADKTDLVAELVGREREFSAIQRLWQEARTKGARRVHITGASGLGKTRLVLDACARLRATRAQVVYVRAAAGERQIPFGFAAALAGAIAEMPGAVGISPNASAALLALNPALSTTFSGAPAVASDRDARLHRGLALLELIAAAADEKPLAIVIDDLHWCDDDSANIVALLAARLSGERVLFVTTARPTANVPPLPDHALRLALEPLTLAQVEQLVTSIATLPNEPWAAELPRLITGCARGHPLITLESLRLCVDAGVLVRGEREWSCPAPERLACVLKPGLVIQRRLEDLSPDERTVLLACSLAGVPTGAPLAAAAAGLASERAEAAANALEHRGLLGRAGSSWAPVHDEIADAAISTADAATLRESHARLGRAATASADPAWRRRGLQHLALGEDWPSLASAMARALSERGAALGDVQQAIAELLGPAASPDLVDRVRHSLPITLRHRRAIRRLAFVAATAVVVSGAILTMQRNGSGPAPEANLFVGIADDSSSTLTGRIPILRDGWNSASPLQVSRNERAARWNGPSLLVFDGLPRPGREEWAIATPMNDSGGLDVELMTRTGARRRITASRGDDRPEAFSPDGNQLLIGTARWNHEGRLQLAVVDLSTLALRRVTTSDANDWDAKWSPDGTRIAFKRLLQAGADPMLCTVGIDGLGERCDRPSGWSVNVLFGWIDPQHVLAQARSAQAYSVVRIDVDRGIVTPTKIPDEGVLNLDPLGRWYLVRRGTTRRDPDWRVAAVDQPAIERRVEVLGGGAGSVAFWSGGDARADFLDRLAIERSTGPIAVGVPHQLRAQAWARSGTEITPSEVRWRIRDSRIAQITPSGVLFARDTGAVVVEVSSGGWRFATDTLVVERVPTTDVIEERWDTAAFSRWRLFGDPLPVIVADGRGGHAFLNNGDGNFFSGAWLPTPLDASRGLAVDMDLSTPITALKWQYISVGVLAFRNVAELARWDHRSGEFPTDQLRATGSCLFSYVAGEFPEALRRISGSELPNAPGSTRPRIASGVWYRIRLQVFPDGRCGQAIDGKPQVLSPPQDASKWPVYLFAQGHSVGTKMLIGRIRVRAGVPADIDWSVVDGGGAGARRAQPE